jgi:hypothetical protein
MTKTPEEMAEGELIECAGCKQYLNEKSFWVVSDFEIPITLCEKCYSLLRTYSNESIT